MYLCVWLGGTDAKLEGVGKYLLVSSKWWRRLFCVAMTEYSRLGVFRVQMAGGLVSKVILMAPESRLRDTTVSVKTVVKSSAKSQVCPATAFLGAEAERDVVGWSSGCALWRRCAL